MNCKPGDLAIIIGVRDERCTSNIGCPVTVLRLALATDASEWWVRPARPLLMLCAQAPWLDPILADYPAMVLDRHLMPIRGLTNDEQVRDELVHAG